MNPLRWIRERFSATSRMIAAARESIRPKAAGRTPGPLHAVMHCPACGKQHLDEGEWATRPHHKHLCLHCGHLWRVEPYTFGVASESLPAPPKALGHSGFLKWKKTLDKPEENDREQ